MAYINDIVSIVLSSIPIPFTTLNLTSVAKYAPS